MAVCAQYNDVEALKIITRTREGLQRVWEGRDVADADVLLFIALIKAHLLALEEDAAARKRAWCFCHRRLFLVDVSTECPNAQVRTVLDLLLTRPAFGFKRVLFGQCPHHERRNVLCEALLLECA